jgi:uncharacterized protein YqjF (DUF2071 family)
MTGVHPWWAPPFKPLSNFHETNVRTYVHYNGANPGVWFFSLDAANSIAVRIARSVWKLPYHRANMRLEVINKSSSNEQTSIEYESKRLWPGPTPANCNVTCIPSGCRSASVPGTLEHFLIERYILYAYREQKLYRGQVHHAAYPVQSCNVSGLSETLISAAGIEHGGESPLAHYASEVSVRIYPLKRVTGSGDR